MLSGICGVVHQGRARRPPGEGTLEEPGAQVQVSLLNFKLAIQQNEEFNLFYLRKVLRDGPALVVRGGQPA